MPSVEWVNLEARTQEVSGIISIFTNGFLMILILTKSPPRLGSYKWLMLYTSFFEFFYAFVNLFAGPSVHTFGCSFIVFQDMTNFRWSAGVAQFLVVTYCSCFGFSMAIFGGHFIYRYGAVDIDFRQKYLAGSKQLMLYILPFFYGILWGIICWICYDESKERSDYLSETMIDNYRLNISDVSYISAQFWPVDPVTQMEHPDIRSFLGIAVMWIILGTSFFSVVYYGCRCYRCISKQLDHVENQSEVTKSLQKQLFNALIIQSAIPCVLMYAPAGMVFIFPMLGVELDLKYPFIGLTIAVYPAIDPLPTISIIRSYREGCVDIVKKLLICKKSNRVGEGGQQSKYSETVARISSTAL